MANDPALAALAEMLIRSQRLGSQHLRDQNAIPPVSVRASPPQLPAFQSPGQTMNSFAPMPNMGNLYAQYQAGQKYQTSPIAPPDVAANTQVPPQAASVASPNAAPLSPQMPTADTTVLPMPPPQQIGPAASAQQPSVLADVWQALLKMKGRDPNTPSPWAQNFGNMSDQRG